MKHIPNLTFNIITGAEATMIFTSDTPEPLTMRLAAIIALSAKSCTGAEAAKTMALNLKLMALKPDVGELLLEDAEFDKISAACNSPERPLFSGFIHGQIFNLLNDAKSA